MPSVPPPAEREARTGPITTVVVPSLGSLCLAISHHSLENLPRPFLTALRCRTANWRRAPLRTSALDTIPEHDFPLGALIPTTGPMSRQSDFSWSFPRVFSRENSRPLPREPAADDSEDAIQRDRTANDEFWELSRTRNL